MRKIFKTDEFIELPSVAEIPDQVFDVPPVQQDIAEQTADEAYLQRQHIQRETRQAMQAEFNQKLTEMRAKLQAEQAAKLRLTDTLCEARQVKSKAEAEACIEKAHREADAIRQAAHDAGYADGISVKAAELDAALAEIGTQLKKMKAQQEQFQSYYAEQLRGLALEVSEKLVCERLAEDDKLMLRLIKKAIKPLREASWIRIDVSDRLGARAEMLEQELARFRPSQHIEVETRRDAHPGTCVIQTAEGVVIASVLTQLENIRTYFEDYEENDEHSKAESGALNPDDSDESVLYNTGED